LPVQSRRCQTYFTQSRGKPCKASQITFASKENRFLLFSVDHESSGDSCTVACLHAVQLRAELVFELDYMECLANRLESADYQCVRP